MFASEGLAIAIAVLIFVVITIAKGVRLVAQGEEWVVERLGKYHATLRPGLNILIPYLDRVAYKLVTKDIILDVQEQEVITRDNAVILTNAIAFVKVTDPVKAVYGVTDFSEAIRNLIMTTLPSAAPLRVIDPLKWPKRFRSMGAGVPALLTVLTVSPCATRRTPLAMVMTTKISTAIAMARPSDANTLSFPC